MYLPIWTLKAVLHMLFLNPYIQYNSCILVMCTLLQFQQDTSWSYACYAPGLIGLKLPPWCSHEPLFFIRSPKTHSPSSQLIHKTKSKFEKKLDVLFDVVIFISVNTVQGWNIAKVTFVMSFIANTPKNSPWKFFYKLLASFCIRVIWFMYCFVWQKRINQFLLFHKVGRYVTIFVFQTVIWTMHYSTRILATLIHFNLDMLGLFL